MEENKIIKKKIELELDIKKTIEENASYYFEKSKKLKKKLKGAKEALKIFEEEQKKIKEEKTKETKKETKEEKIEKKYYWYMKYRWFFTSKNHLVIGGRDANTNEEIIKKRLEKKDLVFHADVNGSPFFILKLEKEEQKKYLEEKENEKYKREIQEVIDATASYSRAWKYGLSIIECFFVLPEQVSKKAKAGEYLQKGSFMIYGKKNIFTGILKLYVRIIYLGEEKTPYIMISPVKHEENFIELTPGKTKVSDAAKEIKKYLEKKGIKKITLDEIIKNLPGNVEIKYIKK